jgi:hypothetical protein
MGQNIAMELAIMNRLYGNQMSQGQGCHHTISIL